MAAQTPLANQCDCCHLTDIESGNSEGEGDDKQETKSVESEASCCGGCDQTSSDIEPEPVSIVKDGQVACCTPSHEPNDNDMESLCAYACCSGVETGPERNQKIIGTNFQDACCSNDSTGLERNERVVDTGCQDACCSGDSQAPERNEMVKTGCQGPCGSGDNEGAESNEEAVETCQDGCCADSIASMEKPKQTPKCGDECCSNDEENESTKSENVAELIPQKLGAVEDSCNDKCCSSPKGKAVERDTTPACCEGKSAPCCDVSCVDRLAVRECDSDCNTSSSDCKSQAEGTACATHKERARKKYASKLAALECICRALVALGQESCCITKESSLSDVRRRRKKGWRRSNASTYPCKEQLHGTLNDGASSCCNVKSEGQSSTCRRGGSKSADISPRRAAKQNAAATVTEKEVPNQDSISTFPDKAPLHYKDVEKGVSNNDLIALSISGMTCTGCETKLQRVLGNVSAVTNLKTSLVMARAEFNLDAASMSPESVIQHLERTTEFKCERIATEGTVVEVIPLSDIHEFMKQPLPMGVNNMQLVNRGAVRVNYDPKIIGVRELLEEKLDLPSQLAPHTADPGLAAGSRHVRNMGYMTILSIVLTIPVLVLAWAPIKSRPIPYGATSLALATAIQIVIAGPFYPKALKSLIFSRMIEMDLLIVLSTSAAYIFSVVSFGFLASGRPLSTGEFFETSTLLVSLIMIGRWIGALARQKAVESISIRSLQPSTVQLVMEDGTPKAEVDTRLLQYRDMFSVLPEHRVPTDGIVVSGSSETDESMLTGESRPIEKHVGSKVIAGSINGSGKLIVRLTHLPGENTISTIAGMVDSAKMTKPKIQDLADRVASYFVPVILFLSTVTFVVWIGVGVAVQKKTGSEAAIQAVTYAITVLIVSCPCAIGLAVPMVVVIGSGVASEHGIIFKSANSIEIAHKATHVVFDKTGTVTEGKLKVLDEQYFAEDTEDGRSMILGLVANSKHPVSAAVAAHLKERGICPAQVDGVKTVAGKGIEGAIDAKAIRGGNARWLAVESDPRVEAAPARGYTNFCITLDSKLYAVFHLSDTLRPEAATAIAKLKRKGIHVCLLSGDDTGAVQRTAAEVGLNHDEARSRCSPRDKQEYVSQLLEQSVGKDKATVIFVGDGTNDAVALAQASVGVHMGNGTDVAQSAADVLLMRPSLEGVLTMIDISRAAVLRIKFNFAWSFVYNALALLFACGALSSAANGHAIRIPPQYAGLGELVSVLPVIVIAVGLKWVKF